MTSKEYQNPLCLREVPRSPLFAGTFCWLLWMTTIDLPANVTLKVRLEHPAFFLGEEYSNLTSQNQDGCAQGLAQAFGTVHVHLIVPSQQAHAYQANKYHR